MELSFPKPSLLARALVLAFQEEFDNLRYYLTGALIEFLFREIRDGMGHRQVFVVGETPGLGHGATRSVKHIGDNRGGGNTVFFKQNAVEHTARAA